MSADWPSPFIFQFSNGSRAGSSHSGRCRAVESPSLSSSTQHHTTWAGFHRETLRQGFAITPLPRLSHPLIGPLAKWAFSVGGENETGRNLDHMDGLLWEHEMPIAGYTVRQLAGWQLHPSSHRQLFLAGSGRIFDMPCPSCCLRSAVVGQ